MSLDPSAWRGAHQLSATVHTTFPGNSFLETDLVSDVIIPGHPVQTIDANLVNPWGIAYAPNGPFWINDNNATPSAVTVYDGNGNPVTVFNSHNVIGFEAPAANPTGEVFNPSGGFMVDGQPAKFLFATENGTIAAWSPGTSDGKADVVIDNSNTSSGFGIGEVYKGLAIGQSHGDTFLFASDFRDGRVEVYNNKFEPVKSFTDPTIPKAYAPFNVQVLDHHLFVTFAVRNSTGHDDLRGKHRGFVDEFDFKGNLIARVASHGALNSPWGLAIAPTGFGKFAGDLLVGNFGDGRINAFDLHTDTFVGTLRDAAGHPIHIDGLWALIAGNHGMHGHPDSIYFTAGINGESDGLFGRLSFNHHAAADLHM
jgi:uncharacterized protein (TIGR03118 family)